MNYVICSVDQDGRKDFDKATSEYKRTGLGILDLLSLELGLQVVEDVRKANEYLRNDKTPSEIKAKLESIIPEKYKSLERVLPVYDKFAMYSSGVSIIRANTQYGKFATGNDYFAFLVEIPEGMGASSVMGRSNASINIDEKHKSVVDLLKPQEELVKFSKEFEDLKKELDDLKLDDIPESAVLRSIDGTRLM